MRRGLPLLLLGLGVFACSSKPKALVPKVDAGPTCASNADCDDGEVCSTTTGQCGACKSSGQCLPHQNCAAPSPSLPNACVYQSGWGDDCKVNGDCPAGELCKQGLCVSQQDVTLCPTFACPAGQLCNRTNLVCEEDEGCFTDTDCDSTQLCNTTTNQCVLRCTTANASMICAADQICVSGRCAQCATNADCTGGLTCNVTAGICSNGNTCFTDRDCDVPLVCNPATSQCTQPPPACVSDEQCPSGDSCDLASGFCVPSGCQPDAYEPNDTAGTAASIGQGPDINVSGLTLCNGIPGFFSFPLLQGDLVQVVVEADTLAADTFSTTLLDPLGRAIGTGDLVAQGQADRDGTFLVRVQSTDSSQTYALRVQIDHTTMACQNDVYEPNNTVAQATRLTTPGLNTLAICAADLDYYYIEVPTGLGVRFEQDSDESQGTLQLFVYASDGVTALGADMSGTDAEVVDIGADVAGGQRIYALVEGLEARSENQYSLQVAFELPVPDAGPVDAGEPSADAGEQDGGEQDAGVPDAGLLADGGPG